MNPDAVNNPNLIRASTLLALAAALSAGNADAVTIYRCGATGNSFSDRPCANGQAFDAEDARSDAQRAEAVRVAAVDRRLAAELQRDRMRLAAAAPRMAAGFNANPPPTPVTVASTDTGRRNAPRTAQKQLPFATDRVEFVAFAPAVKVGRR